MERDERLPGLDRDLLAELDRLRENDLFLGGQERDTGDLAQVHADGIVDRHLVRVGDDLDLVGVRLRRRRGRRSRLEIRHRRLERIDRHEVGADGQAGIHRLVGRDLGTGVGRRRGLTGRPTTVGAGFVEDVRHWFSGSLGDTPVGPRARRAWTAFGFAGRRTPRLDNRRPPFPGDRRA